MKCKFDAIYPHIYHIADFHMQQQDVILLFVHYRWNKDVVCQLGSMHIPPHAQQQHQEVFYFEMRHIKEARFGLKLF